MQNTRREVAMETQYDLFEMIPGTFPRWVGAAATLEHARIRLRDLSQARTGGEYFVRDFYSGSVVAFAAGSPTHSHRRKRRQRRVATS
jgi:hypothetical protein